jgi:beta-glucosidase/6-phospho-beta-glucosidase/beta-galactosidase
LTQAAEVETINLTSQTVDEVVNVTVAFCEESSVASHVEILRYFQKKMVIGRVLEVENVVQATEGETNYINVDRHNLMETSFEEIMFLGEYRKTLQVQFYGEVCNIDI